VPTAIAYRESLGGEVAIRTYVRNLARAGGQRVAKILGTKVLDNASQTMSDCCMTTFLLPMTASPGKASEEHFAAFEADKKVEVTQYMLETLIQEYKTFVAIFEFQGQWWGRLSAQVYLEMEDFEWAGAKLKELCDRVGRGEWKGKQVDDMGEALEGMDLAKDGQGANA
jgi:hypothetical protein